MNRPLQNISTDLLVWMFWNLPDNIEGHDRMIQECHAELNARGEGGKVAV